MKLFLNLYLILAFASLMTESILKPISFLPDGRLLLISLILVLIILRYKKMQIFHQKLKRINDLVLVVLTFFAFAVLLVENIYGFQYVYSQFGLSYSRIFYLTLASAILALYFASFNLTKRFLKRTIFVSPIYLALGGFFIYLRNNHLFRLWVQDDHVVEYLQFFLLLISAWFCFKLFRHWWQKEKVLGVLFLMATFICLFVAGEEISWGQRLLGLQTPESLAERNLQDEITLHNVDVVFGHVYRGYMLIGFVGSTSWVVLRMIKNKISQRLKRIFYNIIPDWYLTPYFAVAFFYNWDRFYLRPRTGEALWEEPMELLLIIGITIFFGIKYLRVYPEKIKKIKPEILDD
jgi:hypothetical protein